MKRARYNEVPKDYRRNYKKEIVEFIQMAVLGIGFGASLTLIIFMGL